ncbi:uncharacterized protein BDR25DRAFT_164428, partial [Lindgomyces ingoldianus]
FDWAHNAYIALNDPHPSSGKWPVFHSNPNQSSLPPSAFTIPPSLLSEASIERYGLVTPPEELSPVESRPDSIIQESSIPVEQRQRIQALADYQPPSRQQEPLPCGQTHEVQGVDQSPRRRRATNPNNPQQPKRKRGRPKSQPQTIEAFSHDDFPFQVASARQTHLEKNRVAAHKCRQRKKEYINSLEARAREYSTRNKALKENVGLLREEVLQLKNEVLRHAGCGFWAVDQYLQRCAGDLLGVDGENMMGSRKHNQADSPTLSTFCKTEDEFDHGFETSPSQTTADSNQDLGGLELLDGFDED